MAEQVNRRQFLAYGVAGAASLVIPVGAAQAASPMDVFTLMRLHPVRFVAGLVFDVAMAVVVEFAKDAIVAALRDGNRPVVALGRSSGTERASEFQHANYKASVVVLGVADYEAYRARQLRLLLNNPQQMQRYQVALDYLRDERIRIKLADREYSQPAGADTVPDDLFTMDYFQMDNHQEQHYRNLLAATGTSAFDDWRV